MIRSARPEKAVLKMVGRFFRSSAYLISQTTWNQEKSTSLLTRWQTAYHRNEMQTLPDKINAWAQTIDHKLFPGNSPDQVESLVVSLQSLAFRVADMLNAKKSAASISIEANELHKDLETWRDSTGMVLAQWSREPGEQTDEHRLKIAKTWLSNFEKKTDAVIAANGKGVSLEERERLFQLMIGFRGVSQAALAYAQVARNTDWEEWREERFS